MGTARTRVPARTYRIVIAGDIGANPDQRMHEDARRLAELSADLGIGLLQGSILLAANILWGNFEWIRVPCRRPDARDSGYMVWAALHLRGLHLAGEFLGRTLPLECNAEGYAREAALRFMRQPRRELTNRRMVMVHFLRKRRESRTLGRRLSTSRLIRRQPMVFVVLLIY